MLQLSVRLHDRHTFYSRNAYLQYYYWSENKINIALYMAKTIGAKRKNVSQGKEMENGISSLQVPNFENNQQKRTH